MRLKVVDLALSNLRRHLQKQARRLLRLTRRLRQRPSPIAASELLHRLDELIMLLQVRVEGDEETEREGAR